MKYQSSNILKDFEFHDALFTLESYKNRVLAVAVRYLNIHKTAEQNQNPTDMELESAIITFNGFQMESFEPGRTWNKNDDGELYTDEPQIVFQGAIAEEKFLSELRAGTTVFAFGLDGKYYLEGCGDEPWFLAYFHFSSATIEWDSYRKPAWYEEKHK